MPKRSWNLNTVYISERLQECLRPISRCALTTVVAPMGYGKTTAVNWYLVERAKARRSRRSCVSASIRTIWPSSGRACRTPFPTRGSTFCATTPAPTDAAGGSLLADDLCHALAGKRPCYIFIDDFHLLTDNRVRRLSLHADQPPAGERSPDRRQPRPLPARGGDRAPGRTGLPDRRRAAAAQPHGAVDLRPPLRHGALGRADRERCSIRARGGFRPFT